MTGYTVPRIAEVFRHHVGWCPHTPVLRAPPAILAVPLATANPLPPSGGAAGQGRFRRGIDIATGSIRTLIRERHLLRFSFLSGIAILFLFLTEGLSVTHIAHIPLLSSIGIPFGDSGLAVFSVQLFLIEAISLSAFTCVLACLVMYRNEDRSSVSVTIGNAFDRIKSHAGSLAAFSLAMAFAATVIFEIVSQSQFIGRILFTIGMALFNLPYAYYLPGGVTSMYYFSFRIMAINIVLFLLTLYVVPGIVLENKRLLSALAGSVSLMKKTWRELLGCSFVLGIIVLMVTAIALVIGQSPLLLNHDYDFFLQMSRGQVLMTIVCYGFLLACGVLMAVGSTVLGIAITELYTGEITSPEHLITDTAIHTSVAGNAR